MKTKALLVYITLGAAFAAVSLWVFFSHGKNAKAIRTKYKLGGAMIAAWALLSASGQAPPPPEVTCYEPPSPPNEINVRPKKGGDCQLHIGGHPSGAHLRPRIRDIPRKSPLCRR